MRTEGHSVLFCIALRQIKMIPPSSKNFHITVPEPSGPFSPHFPPQGLSSDIHDATPSSLRLLPFRCDSCTETWSVHNSLSIFRCYFDMMGQIGTPIIAIESGYVEALGWNQYGGWRIGKFFHSVSPPSPFGVSIENSPTIPLSTAP